MWYHGQVESAPAALTADESCLNTGVADGIERPLDPRVVTVDRIGAAITFGVLSLTVLFSGLMLLRTSPSWGMLLFWSLWLIASAALGWATWTWPAVASRHASYKVDRWGIEIRRGVIWRILIDVPRSRVQHTDVAQGPLERRFGLGTLVIYTAGTDHARIDLRGLDYDTALRVRDHLLPKEESDAV